MKRTRNSVGSWRRLAIVMPTAACVIAGLALTNPASAGASVRQVRDEANLQGLHGSVGCAKGSASGITATSVQLKITVVDISGGSLSNTTVGLPSAQAQEKDWNLVANSINKAGGAGCRKIALSFSDVNPIDPAGAEQDCLAIASSHPYMTLDVGALTDVNASNCIPIAKVPLVSEVLTPDQLSKFYPYYLQVGGVPTDALKNGVLGLSQLGYFKASKGFKKLGVLYATCNPALIAAERAALKQAGIPSAKTVYFSLGCPTGQAFTAASIEQAVLSFKNAGVTDVTNVAGGTATFTQQAAQQNYKPMYLLSNDVVASNVATGLNAPDASNFNGAVNITGDAYGEQTTPGYKPSGGTKKCNAIFTAAKMPTVYDQADGFGGVACNYLWYVQALLNQSTTVQQSKLAATLHKVGTLNFSYPSAPVNFSAAPKNAPYGNSLWRAETYLASCKCWHVTNPTWNQPFK
jgi:hypothetical protein